MSTQPIDFSSIGGKPVQQAPIDFSSIGGKRVEEPAQPKAEATISAQPEPTGVMDRFAKWTDNVSNDIKHGTDLTGIGTVLKKMGAHGVYNGNPEAVGDFMASLPLGLLKASKGAAEMQQPGKTMQGAGNVISGGLQAATIPSAFVAPEGAEAAAAVPGKVAGKLESAVPSFERAKANFQAVMVAAKERPVSLENSQDAILKMVDWQKKTQLGPTVNKFLNRVTNPKLGDLTYEEARDFYQLLGRLSSDETSKMPPAIRFDLTRMVTGLKTDVGNAAQSVGKGQQYYAAMKEFASAKRMEDVSDATKQIIMEVLKRAFGAGLAAYSAKKIWDATH